MHLMVRGDLVSIPVQSLLRHAFYTDKKRFQSTFRLYRHTTGQAAFITFHHRHKDFRIMLYGYRAATAAGDAATPTACNTAAGDASASTACYTLHGNKLGSFYKQPMQGYFLYANTDDLSRKQNSDTPCIRRQMLRRCISLVSIHQYPMQR